jgi:hypothetical protein
LRALSPGSTNVISDVDAGFVALRDDVSAKLAPHTAGTRASRPTSTVGTPGILGRTYRSTDDGGVDIDTGTSWVTLSPGLFTVLPGSPDAAQMVLFQTAAMVTAGIGPWALRYRTASASAYKWEATGAIPLIAELPAVATTTSATYTDTGTPGPTITLPLSGDYVISHGFESVNGNGSVSQSFIFGGAAAADPERAVVLASSVTDSTSRTVRKLALSATVLVTCKHKTTGGTAIFANRWLSITPIRVA